jgi:hypothetical protein
LLEISAKEHPTYIDTNDTPEAGKLQVVFMSKTVAPNNPSSMKKSRPKPPFLSL